MIAIGIDVGYDSTKVVTFNNNGSLNYFSYESIVGVGRPESINGELLQKVQTVNYNGQVYTVGFDAIKYKLPILTVKARNSIESIAYRVLIKNALDMINKNQEVEFFVVTGLPVEFFEEDKKILQTIFKNADNRIKEVRVIPQPAGTFYNLILQDNGQAKQDQKYANSKVGIIDIGRYTTDIAVFDHLDYVSALSKTITIGVEYLIKLIADRLDTRIRRGIKLEEIKKALINNNGYLKRFGQEISIKGAISDAILKIQNDLTSYIRSVWGIEDDIDHIIITGGGANIFEDMLFTIFNISKKVDNPIFSNAIGYLKVSNRYIATMYV